MVRVSPVANIIGTPTHAIKPKKWTRPETTPNKASKWQQLLSKHNPRWTAGESSQQEVQMTQEQEPMEPVLEKTAKPIKIKLCRQDRFRDMDDLVRRVNQETAEEEVEEELVEALQCRPRKCNTK